MLTSISCVPANVFFCRYLLESGRVLSCARAWGICNIEWHLIFQRMRKKTATNKNDNDNDDDKKKKSNKKDYSNYFVQETVGIFRLKWKHSQLY